jgi:fatty acid-binding protein DegV
MRTVAIATDTIGFTPVMGVHTGPGLVGAAFYSEP